jgi:hypothetical protein
MCKHTALDATFVSRSLAFKGILELQERHGEAAGAAVPARLIMTLNDIYDN